MELIRSTGLIEHCHLVPPRAATIQELELVHSPEYVDLVRKLSDPAQRARVPHERVMDAGFDSADNPISDELHEGTGLVVGATMVAAQAVAGGAALHAFSGLCFLILDLLPPRITALVATWIGGRAGVGPLRLDSVLVQKHTILGAFQFRQDGSEDHSVSLS